MQTILGSNGAVGREVAKALKEYTEDIRLVSRNPRKVNPADQLLPADLLSREEAFEAIKGSSVAYVTIGFAYKYKAWKESWPILIDNVTSACMEYNCKLVFFDNIYMYDPSCMGNITEDSPINPPSKKGKIREEIANTIMSLVAQSKLTALIARCADFYGPNIENTSMLAETVFKPLSEGKKANWMGPLDFKHSFTYVPDVGKATALLGNTESAYNQVWHLPTAKNPLTGREWIETIAIEMGVKPNHQILTRTLAKMLGLFVPIMRELPEMMYQYDRDYLFNSDKFEKEFDFTPTPYETGIKEIMKSDYNR
jgi:nucleoside-diphosphate-sugar epimerase